MTCSNKVVVVMEMVGAVRYSDKVVGEKEREVAVIYIRKMEREVAVNCRCKAEEEKVREVVMTCIRKVEGVMEMHTSINTAKATSSCGHTQALLELKTGILIGCHRKTELVDVR